jgi:hypothetical protein
MKYDIVARASNSMELSPFQEVENLPGSQEIPLAFFGNWKSIVVFKKVCCWLLF